MKLSRLLLALAASSALCAAAHAQPVQYQAADGINNTPVSTATPLPTTCILGCSGSSFVATSSAPINVSTAVTTQLVALSSGKAIYVDSLDFIAGGTTNVTLEYGTGSLCGTGTTVLTGPYPLTATGGLSKGNGASPVLFVPASNALCIVNSAAVQVSGSVAYAQQ